MMCQYIDKRQKETFLYAKKEIKLHKKCCVLCEIFARAPYYN